MSVCESSIRYTFSTVNSSSALTINSLAFSKASFLIKAVIFTISAATSESVNPAIVGVVAVCVCVGMR